MTGRGTELLRDVCQAVGATTYLSGPRGRDYLDEAMFSDVGVRVAYDDYVHPIYPQHHGGFEPYMAAIDLRATELRRDDRRAALVVV